MAARAFALLFCGMVIATAVAVHALLNEQRVNAQQAVRIAQLAKQVHAPEAPPGGAEVPAHPIVPCPERAPAPSKGNSEAALTAEYEAAVIDKLNASLAQASSAIADLTDRNQKLQAQLDSANADNQRLAASEAQFKDSFDSASRLVDSEQREIKDTAARVAQLENANDDLRRQADAAAGKLAQFNRVWPALQDIQRRRENLLHGVVRRYRDVAEQLRNLGGTSSDAGLERIRNAISMADDDLRQIDALTAQAGRLQKQMEGK